jgi:4-amino-4-deoxy-L-arabinose transferase-like glycosyltransferase
LPGVATQTAPFGIRPRVVPRRGADPAWWLGALTMAGAAAFIVLFVGAGVVRALYPYPLEATEPAALNEVERILAGQALYVPPTLEHIPLIYGPIYFYLSAALASVLGATFVPLRLVSLAASLASIWLVFRFVQLETGNVRCALAAAGLLAACNPLAQTAMDIGRVDAVFTMLVLASAFIIRRNMLSGARASWVSWSASGVLLALAAFTKVPMAAAPIAAGLVVAVALLARRGVLPLVVGLLATGAVLVAVLRLQSGAWATWYLWDLPRQHAFGRELIGRFWFVDVLPRLTLPLALGPMFLVGSAGRGDRGPLVFYGLFVGSLLGVSWASRANGGGAENVLLPACAGLAIMFGLGLHELLRHLTSRPLQMYVFGLAVAQLALLIYNPRTIVPLRTDAQADVKLGAAIGALPGPIFAPDFAGYLSPADRRQQPLSGAVYELEGGYGGQPTVEGRQWNAALDAALAEHRFRVVVLQRVECCLEERVLRSGYRGVGSPFRDDDEFYSWRTKRTPDPKMYVAPSP